jgi:very-short-patch-repair endonuclease
MKLKFRRQHVIEGFVVDFFCHRLNLAVEIDGWVHERQKGYDRFRDNILKS